MPTNTLNANSLFFCAIKIKPARKVLDALRHNKRTIQAELGSFGHIDASKIPLNYCLEGCADPEQGYRSTQDAIEQYNRNRQAKMRHDAVIAAELVFSIPATRTDINYQEFFKDCLIWCKQEFPDHPMISADVHLDEASPHMHILIGCVLPKQLLGSKSFGYGKAFNMRNLRFFDEVAKLYGLEAPHNSLTSKDRNTLCQHIFNKLQNTNDPMLKSKCFNSVRKAIQRDPILFATDLGVEITLSPSPIKRIKKMSVIFTSKGKGSNHLP
jgi:hypothetical protein